MSVELGIRGALHPRLAELRRAVRRRAFAIYTCLALPSIVACPVIVNRYWGVWEGAACAFVAVAAAMLWIKRRTRVYDARWLVRNINASVPAFEDSADLLLGDKTGARRMGSLAALQTARLQKRLQDLALPDLRPDYPRRTFLITWGGVLLLSTGCLIGPDLSQKLRPSGPPPKPPPSGASIETRLRVSPPAYTGLPAQELNSLDGRVPEGSRVTFALRVGSDPTRAALVFEGGDRLELHRDGAIWSEERIVTSATLFRLSLEGAAQDGVTAQRLHRLDILSDQAPKIIVRLPERTLSVAAAGQKSWDLTFEASDDYGLGSAQLSIVHAQGSGEQIKTTQAVIGLEGRGDARHREYRKTLDLSALGFAEGDDLIVRLSVGDNYPPRPHITESESLILRWPTRLEAESAGMEGLVQKTLPAYFASERQIIIDSEALLAQRVSLPAARFAARANELGVEQKVLRLRYGEFLGEESERSAQHDDDTASTSKAFGEAGNITSEYWHVHDRPEATTLFDQDTRRILKSALDEMWQAELNLRQAHPDAALPDEYKALEYIKQVQQAERIYLARTGVQLPQGDADRRLTGDRTGLSDREFAPSIQAADDSTILQLWQSLHGQGSPDWPRLTAWMRQRQGSIPDALGFRTAADRLQRDPTCGPCRDDLANRLWPLLPRSGAALQPRREPDASGAAYLRALAAPATAP